jgi:hypothetical protein
MSRALSCRREEARKTVRCTSRVKQLPAVRALRQRAGRTDRNLGTTTAASAVEYRQVQRAKARRVGEQVDLDDAAVRDREAGHREREGCQNQVPSSSSPDILVQQAAEPIAGADGTCIRSRMELDRIWWMSIQCAMRALPVVVPDVNAQHSFEG